MKLWCLIEGRIVMNHDGNFVIIIFAVMVQPNISSYYYSTEKCSGEDHQWQKKTMYRSKLDDSKAI